MVVTGVTPASSYSASSEADVQMKGVKFPKYHFIPSDDQLLKNEGFRVPDQFVGKYGPKIPRLTVPYFISLCQEFYGVTKPTISDLLDEGINFDDSEGVIPKKKNWDISQGVSPKCLTFICKTLNISCYSYDITQKCFMKYVAPFRNYDALVYYCVNNHMYWISDQKAALCLIQGAADVEHKIKSVALPEEKSEKENVYEILEIMDHVLIEDLTKHKDKIVIYDQSDLNDELDEIIRIYNYIPKVRNKQFAITEKRFDLNDQHICLATDPNDTRVISYTGIRTLCERHDLEFKNQSFGSVVQELRDKFFQWALPEEALHQRTTHQDAYWLQRCVCFLL